MKYLFVAFIFLFGCEAPAAPTPVPIPASGPDWTTYSPVRSVRDFGPILTDTEAHLPQGHPYANASDVVNWVHESIHGINSDLRQKYRCAGFYCLDNRAVLLNNPPITLTDVAREVPASLRGFCYNLYFIQQRADWNEVPTYVFDEAVAYTGGAEARVKRNIPDRNDTVQFCLEFVPYSICVAKAAHDAGLPEDPQVTAFIRWQTERCIRLGKEINMPLPNMMSNDAASFRDFCHLYFGPDWTLKNLGF